MENPGAIDAAAAAVNAHLAAGPSWVLAGVSKHLTGVLHLSSEKSLLGSDVVRRWVKRCDNSVLVTFCISMTEATVIWEEGILTEKMLP